jgi:hypothetical protein
MSMPSEGASVVRRRHVIYVEGYDPQGAEGYYHLFERSWRRFLKLWPLRTTLGELKLDPPDFAHWDIEAHGPNWHVTTRYEFHRQEAMIRANMAEPMWRQIPRALGWTLDYLVSGALVRVLAAGWPFGLALIHFQLLMLLWLGLSVAAGWYAASVASTHFALPLAIVPLVGVAAACGVFAALRPLADRHHVVQINNHWPYLCEFARGEPTCFDEPIDACARRLIDVVRGNEVDEILLIGHSGGGVTAPAVMVRALELDPQLGRRGLPVVLLTLGSIAPGAALHPKAHRLRAIFARLAVEPSVQWVDCQSRRDALNFWNFDPVAGIGVHVGADRCNPIVWKLRFRDMLSPQFYKRLRWDLFRMHYQFIMANDQRAPYDFFMLVCGPVRVPQWATDANTVLAAFAEDGTWNARALSVAAAERATPE